MSRKPQRLIGAAVIVFWGTMMALLVWREGDFGAPTPTEIARARLTEPTSLWMGIYAGEDQRIGTVNVRSVPEPRNADPGARFFFRTDLSTNVLGQDTRFALDGSAWVSAERGMQEFDVTMRSGPHEVRLDGKQNEGRLTGTLHAGGESLPFDLAMPDALFAPGSALPGMAMPRMRPGDSLELDAFDPVAMTPRRATVRCIGSEMRVIEGEPVETYVVETKLGLLTTKAWLSGEGEVLRAETPFGFAIERITEAEALTGRSGGQELLGIFAVKASGKTPWRGAHFLKLRVSGAPVENVPGGTAHQRRQGRIFEMMTPAEPAEAESGDLRALAEHLGSDAFVTPDHPKVQAAARKAIGEARTPWEKAKRLHDWIYENIEKTPAITLPTALDVLDTRHGDCNEHAVLYTAMARAVELPTRIAVGLVWSDELAGFGYHAWVEVWCGNEWTPMDPTLGQPVADATHLKLIEGGIEQWTKLLPYLSDFQIEVLEVR